VTESSRMTTPSRRSLVGASLAALALVALVVLSATTNERKTTSMTTPTLVHTGLIPPIDAAAPAQTETATFGLG